MEGSIQNDCYLIDLQGLTQPYLTTMHRLSLFVCLFIIFTVFSNLLIGTFGVIYLLIQKQLFHSYYVSCPMLATLGMNGYGGCAPGAQSPEGARYVTVLL